MMIQKKELDYAKETGEVAELLVEVVKTIKNKGDYMAIMPKLVAAVDGVAEIDDETAENRKVVAATLGYHTGELTDALLTKQA